MMSGRRRTACVFAGFRHFGCNALTCGDAATVVCQAIARGECWGKFGASLGGCVFGACDCRAILGCGVSVRAENQSAAFRRVLALPVVVVLVSRCQLRRRTWAASRRSSNPAPATWKPRLLLEPGLFVDSACHFSHSLESSGSCATRVHGLHGDGLRRRRASSSRRCPRTLARLGFGASFMCCPFADGTWGCVTARVVRRNREWGRSGAARRRAGLGAS